jgi:hypothetical protein
MKKIIGRRDKADFPDLELTEVPIKIDTGAYTSSIHCTKFEVKDGILYANFSDGIKNSPNKKRVKFTAFEEVKVKSSNGQVQKRYVIISRINLFGKLYKISLTLADRKKMKNPVLIGRKFLNKKFIVDTDLEYVSHKTKLHEH